MTFTKHGHHIPGTIRDKYNPDSVARCGGTHVCSQCQQDAANAATFTAEVVAPRPIGIQLQELTATQGTIYKVYDALKDSGLTRQQALDAINQMQNAGIYFREAKED